MADLWSSLRVRPMTVGDATQVNGRFEEVGELTTTQDGRPIGYRTIKRRKTG